MTDLTGLTLVELRALRDSYAAIMVEHGNWHPTGGWGCHVGDARSWAWAEAGFRACCEEQERRHETMKRRAA